MEVTFDITPIIVGIAVVIGGYLTANVMIKHKDSSSKYTKSKMKEQDEYVEFLKKQMRTYKAKASNIEKGPQIEGDVSELGGLIPELVGQFGDYLPKWAQPFVKDPDMQKWLFEYIEKNPDKAKQWFGKIIGNKHAAKKEESTSNEIAV